MKIIFEVMDRVRLASGVCLEYKGLNGSNYISGDVIGTIVEESCGQFNITWTTHDGQKIDRSFNSFHLLPVIDFYEQQLSILKEKYLALDKIVINVQKALE